MPVTHTVREQVLAAIAGATILGGGSVTLKTWYENGQQDVRIQMLQEQRAADSTKLDEIVVGVAETRTTVREIKERLDREQP